MELLRVGFWLLGARVDQFDIDQVGELLELGFEVRKRVELVENVVVADS